ncbi:MAG: diguanylate cyclase [Candidatus Sumerlaeia bacterium]|nr:diguanylate cyclase [Candidatus Sumerlaeia bacterium]
MESQTEPIELLIAEDDSSTLAILCRKAQEWGYTPVPTSKGAEALERLLDPAGPRLALLDWMLPDSTSGLDICRELDRRRQTPRTYRIILTARSTQEDLIEALEAGADDCLAKPVVPGILRSRLNVGRRFVELDRELHRKNRELQQLAHDMAAQYLFQKSLIDAIPLPVFVRNVEGVFASCNARFAQFLGVDETTIVGRRLEEFATPELAEVYRQADDDLLRDGTLQQYESAVTHADGSRHEVLFHKAPFLGPEGEHGGIIGTLVDITERKQLESELQRLATTDPLTGVNNRRHFLGFAQKELARVRRHGSPTSLLMLDIDHFKRVNDTYGHSVGDLALKLVAQVLTEALREGDIFGRLGGEEFAVLLPATPLPGAVGVAERLRRMLATRTFMADGEALSITVSIGATAFHPGDTHVDAILERADTALYRAKNNGRNRVESNE